MSQSEIAQILNALDELKKEIVALKAWQTQRDAEKHDADVRRDAYVRPVRYALALSQSKLGPWVFAAIGVAWATLKG